MTDSSASVLRGLNFLYFQLRAHERQSGDLIMSFHGTLAKVTRIPGKFRFDIIVELVRSDRRGSFPECTWESSGIWIKGEGTNFRLPRTEPGTGVASEAESASFVMGFLTTPLHLNSECSGIL